MPDQGPFFQAEQGVARRATRERATMLSGLGDVGGVGDFGAKNPMKVFKKVGGFGGVFTSSNQFIHVLGLPASLFRLMAGQSLKIHKKRDGG